ncbi:hypothetical protein D0Y65_043051 [Glycine soja]|uniref:Uncharacterized protein n=1 Tax=Glycine soja TaxID=3848 RepID=A0A445GFV1_GLYSO|nr:hypothetical protein D0Y65_043051 [Glycine soja]
MSSLGISFMIGSGKYLGLPSIIGKKKKQVFGFLKDRLWRRINHWSAESDKELLALIQEWEKPSSNFLKLNIDAALFIDQQCFGLGLCIRDHSSGFVRAKSFLLQGNPNLGKLLGVLHALQYGCCFKPNDGKFDNRGKVAATPNCALTAVVTNPCGEKSPDHSVEDRGHHVHFGAVVEMGNEIQEHHYEEGGDKLQRESKEETTIPSLAKDIEVFEMLSQPTLRWEGDARLTGVSSKGGKCAESPPTFIRGKLRKNWKGVVYEL